MLFVLFVGILLKFITVTASNIYELNMTLVGVFSPNHHLTFVNHSVARLTASPSLPRHLSD